MKQLGRDISGDARRNVIRKCENQAFSMSRPRNSAQGLAILPIWY